MTSTAGHAGHPWRRYVAIGDSFSEGMVDADPRSEGRFLGWADRLAAELADSAGGEEFRYANLAIRGRKLEDVVGRQLPEAVALQPDLVSMVGGGNDILRPTVDLDSIAARLEEAVVRLRASGADVLLATPTDPRGAGLFSALRTRHAVHTANLHAIAGRHGAHVLDLWGMRSMRDPRMWGEDRIHPSSEGHRRLRWAAMQALGLPVPDDWDQPLTPAPRRPRGEVRAEQLAWARAHAVPWVQRRLTGRSSGDSVTAKRAELTPFARWDLPEEPR